MPGRLRFNRSTKRFGGRARCCCARSARSGVCRLTTVRIILSAVLPAVLLMLVALPSAGRTQDETEWHTGPALERQLALPVGITWSEMPLRQGLRGLASNQRVAVWLDRRIDPDQPIDFTAADVPLERALLEIAVRVDADLAMIGDVAYVGPSSTARRLPTVVALLNESAAKLPVAARQRFDEPAALRWPELTAPRELLAQLARDAGVRVFDQQLVPHDLWPAGDVPPLPLTERLSLVLAGFELTYVVAPDGSAIRLVPLPENPVITRTFNIRGDAEQRIARLSAELPDVEFERRGTRIVGTGSYGDLESAARLLRGEPVRRPASGGDRRYTLEVTNVPAGAIVSKLKDQAGLKVTVAPEVEANLRSTVSLRVENVTLRELLEQTLLPVGIQFELEGNRLELQPRQ